jgi:SAM-dependent methyltransferase
MSKIADSDVEALARERDQLLVVYRTLNRRHLGNLPLPSEELRMHVGARTSEANFLAQGAASSERVLQYFGTDPEGAILDWGCGTGRTWRWLQMYPAWRDQYHGCDVDHEAIEWLSRAGARNLAICGDRPPLPFPDASFSGMFAFSVLTHIPPPLHREWYEEIRRVLKPSGRAYLTTQGRRIVADGRVRPVDAASFRRDGFVHVRNEGHYKDAALVSETFTRAALADVLEIVDYKDTGYQNMDVILVRRPD